MIAANVTIEEAKPFVYTIDFTANFTSVAATSNYFVEVTQIDTTPPASLRVYELVVKKNSAVIINATDIIRNGPEPSASDQLFNLIYLDQLSTITLRKTGSSDGDIELYALGKDT